MISETSAVKSSEEVAKEIEAEMNAIKEVTLANKRQPEVQEPEDYDTDLEEESRSRFVPNFSSCNWTIILPTRENIVAFFIIRTYIGSKYFK